jgi:UDP-N-acetylmuramoyl-tripeptide--D-alanyl-D-alanine ligase
VLVLGDMFELGLETNKEHEAIVNKLLQIENTCCHFIGTAFYQNKCNKKEFYFYDSFSSFAFYLEKNKIENATILIKGSRGMALERALPFL